MEKKEKKPLTPTQKLKIFKAAKWTAFGGEFVAIILPFIIIGLVNYEKYFVEYNGVKMTIAGVLTMALMGFILFVVTSKKIKDFYIPFVVAMAVMTFICFMLGEIITDMSYIMLSGTIGVCAAFGLDIASKEFDKRATRIKNGIEKAEEELIKQSYMEQKSEPQEENNSEEKQKVVIKVKK